MSAAPEMPRGTGSFRDALHRNEAPNEVPDSIQPHGALLAALADTMLVTHASANLFDFLGHHAAELLGQPLHQAVGRAASRAFQSVGRLKKSPLGQLYSISGPAGRTLQLRAFRSGRHICIDIEPVRPKSDQKTAAGDAQSILETFKSASTRVELCALAVRGLKEIAGYDRVIAYRFGQDGHGEVIAEAKDAALEFLPGAALPRERLSASRTCPIPASPGQRNRRTRDACRCLFSPLRPLTAGHHSI